MYFLYNLFARLASALLEFASRFSPKLQLFTEGRKDVFEKLEREISREDKTIWFHAASLGEY